jgi:hypothetical protein
MPFARGTPKPPQSGRRKGVSNKLTKSARDAFQYAFEKTGGAAGLADWAHTHRDEFYRLYARLIPTELVGPGPDGAHVVKSIVDVYVSDTPPSPRK